jgi:hypothetical protein
MIPSSEPFVTIPVTVMVAPIVNVLASAISVCEKPINGKIVIASIVVILFISLLILIDSIFRLKV